MVDTTVEYINLVLQAQGRWLPRTILSLIFRRGNPLNLLARLLERLSGRHLAKRFALLCLRGFSVQEARAQAEILARNLIQEHVIESVVAELKTARTTSRVILASASLEPVVAAIAAALQVEYVASALRTQNDHYTGHFASDLTGQKIEALEAYLGTNLNRFEVVVYSDNFSDLTLLQRSVKPVVVLHSRRDRQRWSALTAKYIEVFN